ncbi:hypothetical protein ILUMI_21797 [Ignelater luminosus]|uniref:PiggyBac transposable element-derived protein domain-containing protein n=1 Tax=Ignelater luminosus TaxID=2038154 RepID=A0A8K0CBR0_IGNLU|nr:hypothetical protein ILUMI_21797 [Ignelater luminosus]
MESNTQIILTKSVESDLDKSDSELPIRIGLHVNGNAPARQESTPNIIRRKIQNSNKSQPFTQESELSEFIKNVHDPTLENIFELFMGKEILDHIAFQRNLYVNQSSYGTGKANNLGSAMRCHVNRLVSTNLTRRRHAMVLKQRVDDGGVGFSPLCGYCIVNSYIIYGMLSLPSLTMRDFRRKVVDHLTAGHFLASVRKRESARQFCFQELCIAAI